MAHTPQHSENPYLFEEEAQIPAKIWELLRRNECFQKTVFRLEELDKQPRNSAGPGEPSPTVIGMEMVENLKEHHIFATIALQWLVPEAAREGAT